MSAGLLQRPHMGRVVPAATSAPGAESRLVTTAADPTRRAGPVAQSNATCGVVQGMERDWRPEARRQAGPGLGSLAVTDVPPCMARHTALAPQHDARWGSPRKPSHHAGKRFLRNSPQSKLTRNEPLALGVEPRVPGAAAGHMSMGAAARQPVWANMSQVRPRSAHAPKMRPGRA